jgi:PAS domain-containing protein
MTSPEHPEQDEASVVTYALTGGNALSKGVTVPLDRSVTQLVLEEREPTVIGDLLADPRYQGLAVQKRGLRSILVFPILLKGTAFGSLNIGAKVVNAFEEEDVQMLAPLAQQMGAIFDRVQLFRQVTEDSTYIHNLLDSIDSIVYTVDTQYRIREVNKAWHEFMKESGVIGVRNYHGVNFFEALPSDALKVMFQNIVDDLLSGRIRIFSQEFVHQTPSGERIYQITVNPMVIDRKITGLVFTHTDITASSGPAG